jgi:hypothetical protein
VFGDRIFLATAIAEEGEAPLKLGAGGEPTAADDNGEQSWVVLCYNKLTGAELWRETAHIKDYRELVVTPRHPMLILV